MSEWGTSVAISKNLMRDLRKRDGLERVFGILRRPLEEKGCTDIHIEKPELLTLYEEYDEDGNGIGEGVETWVINAFGEAE